MKLEAQFRSID